MEMLTEPQTSKNVSIPSIVVCDCEVKNPVEPPYSFEKPWQLGIAVFVTWSQRDGFRDWFEFEGEQLLEYLSAFDIVTGFNVLRFDFRVLDGDIALRRGVVDTLLPAYSNGAVVPEFTAGALRGKTVDMLLDVTERLGHRLKLEQITQPTFGASKTMAGKDAPATWQSRDRLKVIGYCRDDVTLERDVFFHVRQEGRFKYSDWYRNVREVPMQWRLR